MAKSSVTNKSAPDVFAHGEPTVFLEQASAVADLLGCVSPEQCDTKTVNAAGLLIWNLLDAAQQVMLAESEARRPQLAGVKA
jgi:hypothetical protein